ncbi:MAG: hypothetical protein GX635_05165 [Synergistaceae bacterium]|nr:hypothetical protein [Synergistaceae bacterium]
MAEAKWKTDSESPLKNDAKEKTGAVRVRSNVTTVAALSDARGLVPGDILKKYGIRLPLGEMTQKQREEQMYYMPCAICGRTIYEILRDGCDHPGCNARKTSSREKIEAKEDEEVPNQD